MLHHMLRAAAGNSGPDFVRPDHLAAYDMETISGSTLTDLSGNALDCSIVGPTVVAGRVGEALAFVTDDYVRRDLSSSERVQVISLEAWVRFRSGTPAGMIMALTPKGTAADGRGLALIVVNQKPYLRMGTTSSSSFVSLSATTVLSLDTWYYVVGTFDSGLAKIYVNATEEGSQSAVGTINWTDGGTGPSPGQFYLGGDRNNLTGTAANVSFINDAIIDQAGTIGAALTQQEITERYNGGAGA